MKFKVLWDGSRPGVSTIAGQVSIVQLAVAATNHQSVVSTSVDYQGGIPGVRLGGNFLPLINGGAAVPLGRAVTGLIV